MAEDMTHRKELVLKKALRQTQEEEKQNKEDKEANTRDRGIQKSIKCKNL